MYVYASIIYVCCGCVQQAQLTAAFSQLICRLRWQLKWGIKGTRCCRQLRLALLVAALFQFWMHSVLC